MERRNEERNLNNKGEREMHTNKKTKGKQKADKRREKNTVEENRIRRKERQQNR